MLFLVNEEKKTIFGWSAKCGCSHIKNMFYYLQTGIFCEPDQSVHRGKGLDFQPLPENLGEYTLILFIRNPYKRLVSGFLDKYNKNGEFRGSWTVDAPLKFSNFVDALYYKSVMIDRHHFTPQTSEHFNDDIKNHSKTFIFDIDKIDYNLIEYIFGKELPAEVLHYRGEHCRRHKKPFSCDFVFDLPLDLYDDTQLPIRSFYNQDIQQKVENIYQSDFAFFCERGFQYAIK
jgi:hypothetical protein